MSAQDIAYAVKLWEMAGHRVTKCPKGRKFKTRGRATIASRPTRSIYGWQGS